MLVKRSVIVVSVVMIACGTYLTAQDVGREWVLNSAGTVYTRRLAIEATRAKGGNVIGYRVDMQNDSVILQESDSNSMIAVEVEPHFHVRVNKDNRGNAMSLMVRMRRVTYYDLNLDGMWDTMSDSRSEFPKTYIVMKNQYIEVDHSRGGANFDATRSGDGKTRYIFQDGQWQVRL